MHPNFTFRAFYAVLWQRGRSSVQSSPQMRHKNTAGNLDAARTLFFLWTTVSIDTSVCRFASLWTNVSMFTFQVWTNHVHLPNVNQRKHVHLPNVNQRKHVHLPNVNQRKHVHLPNVNQHKHVNPFRLSFSEPKCAPGRHILFLESILQHSPEEIVHYLTITVIIKSIHFMTGQ